MATLKQDVEINAPVQSVYEYYTKSREYQRGLA